VNGRIERIVVPLDAVSENATAVGTAARLAAHWKAHLHGVFVEDEDLLNLAGLPFARQVTLHSGAQPLTAKEVEGYFRVAADTARRALAAAAARHRVKSSFEVVRGSPMGELLGTSERDLIVACSVTRPIGAHFRVECRWWSSVGIAPGSFLLTQRPWSSVGSVLALLRDREPASVRLLEAAALLAEVRAVS
jgi:nucleotide-binding universal stress UspA family protein